MVRPDGVRDGLVPSRAQAVRELSLDAADYRRTLPRRRKRNMGRGTRRLVSCHQSWRPEPAIDCNRVCSGWRESRARHLKRECAVDLHSGGAGADLGVGVSPGRHPADADDGDLRRKRRSGRVRRSQSAGGCVPLDAGGGAHGRRAGRRPRLPPGESVQPPEHLRAGPHERPPAQAAGLSPVPMRRHVSRALDLTTGPQNVSCAISQLCEASRLETREPQTQTRPGKGRNGEGSRWGGLAGESGEFGESLRAVVLETTRPSILWRRATAATSLRSSTVRSGATLSSSGGGGRPPQSRAALAARTRFRSDSSSFRPCRGPQQRHPLSVRFRMGLGSEPRDSQTRLSLRKP